MDDVFEEISEDQNTLTIRHKKYHYVASELMDNHCAMCAFGKEWGCGNYLAVCMSETRNDGTSGYWVEDSEKT